MATQAEPQQREHTRRHTGAVGLTFVGDRPIPKSADEVLQLAGATDFVDDAKLVQPFEGGSVEYVPAAPLADALAGAFAEGRLLLRFTITAEGAEAASYPEPRTYYVHLDFVEGPEPDAGRWAARIIERTGTVRAIVPGVEVTEIYSAHMGDHDLAEEHKRPRITRHGLGLGRVAEMMEHSLSEDGGFDPKVTAALRGWTELEGDWQEWVGPSGTVLGCKRTRYCYYSGAPF